MEAGTQLGPYQIKKPLGAGGMGDVYRAGTLRRAGMWRARCCPPSSARIPGGRPGSRL